LREYQGFEDVKLIIVGGGKEDSDATRRMIESHPECMEYLGKIYEKEKLCEVMRSCAIFAMPSIYETFGLVYIEALSQNLPVLYTKGQGIDGMFDSTIGVSVNPRSVNEIRNALKELFTNHDKYGNQHVDFSMFDWKKISQRYVDDYKSVIAKM
jgi:glycosyltransferase involved in cell wall biosynthesis